MKKLSILFFITLSTCFQLFSSNLENRYSSLSANLLISTGDVEGTAFEIDAIGTISEMGNGGLAFLFSYLHADIEESAGIDLSGLGLEVECNSFNYGLGYIFKMESWHILPYYKFTNNEYGLNGIQTTEVDFSAFGLMFRTMISDTSVLTFNIANTEIDEVEIMGTSLNASNIMSEASYSFDIENEISDSTSFIYGATFVDGSTTFKFGFTINL